MFNNVIVIFHFFLAFRRVITRANQHSFMTSTGSPAAGPPPPAAAPLPPPGAEQPVQHSGVSNFILSRGCWKPRELPAGLDPPPPADWFPPVSGFRPGWIPGWASKQSALQGASQRQGGGGCQCTHPGLVQGSSLATVFDTLRARPPGPITISSFFAANSLLSKLERILLIVCSSKTNIAFWSGCTELELHGHLELLTFPDPIADFGAEPLGQIQAWDPTLDPPGPVGTDCEVHLQQLPPLSADTFGEMLFSSQTINFLPEPGPESDDPGPPPPPCARMCPASAAGSARPRARASWLGAHTGSGSMRHDGSPPHPVRRQSCWSPFRFMQWQL